MKTLIPERPVPDTARRGRQQVFGLNLIRAVAIILVVVDHTFPRPGSVADPSQEVYDLVSKGLTAPDAVLFFMLSGALLLPVAGGWRDFYARRLRRIAIPFVVWSLFYAWVNYEYLFGNEWWMVFQMKWFWLTPTFGPAWFLMTLAGIYLFMPVISPWLERALRRQIEFFLLIWLASGMLPFMTFVMGVEHYDQTVFGMFYNYLGYSVAGFYMMRYPLGAFPRIKGVSVVATLALLGLAFPLLLYYSGWSIDPMEIIPDNLTTGVMAYGCLLFMLLSQVKTLGRAGDRIVNLVSRNAFGIYLCHAAFNIVVIRSFFPEIRGTWFAMPAVVVGSLIVSELLRRIPLVGRYIV